MFYGVRGPRAVRARIPSWFTANYRPARIALRLPGENRPVNDLPAAGDAPFRKNRQLNVVWRARFAARYKYPDISTSCTSVVGSRASKRNPAPQRAGPREPTKLLFLHRGAKMFTALARRRYENREGGEGDGGGARCSASVSYDWAKKSRLLRRKPRPCLVATYLGFYSPTWWQLAHTSYGWARYWTSQ